MTTIEIQTTVCGGFPVIVTAGIDRPDPSVGIFYPWIADLDIVGANGQAVPFIIRKMTDRDHDDVRTAVMEAYTDR